MNNTSIKTENYTAHLHPGKFEGESAATEYFYEQILNGDGETIYSDDLDEWNECYKQAQIFYVNAEEAEAFDFPIGAIFMLREDSQGFVFGSVHGSRAGAEAKFRSWLGL